MVVLTKPTHLVAKSTYPGEPAGKPSTEQLLAHLAALPAGSPARSVLRGRIIEEMLPLAGKLSRRYARRGEPADDLAQVAALALIKAVDGYDPARQIPFVGYAVPSILGALKRHFRDTTWGMKIPRAAQELAHTAAAATGELSQQLRHQPSSVELADHLHVGVPALLAAIGAAQAYHLTSLNTLRADTDGPDPGDRIGAVDDGYDAVDDQLTLTPFIDVLTPRERKILTLRFYDQMTQTQGATEVGLSQMHVSRLLKTSLARLQSLAQTRGEKMR